MIWCETGESVCEAVEGVCDLEWEGCHTYSENGWLVVIRNHQIHQRIPPGEDGVVFSPEVWEVVSHDLLCAEVSDG